MSRRRKPRSLIEAALGSDKSTPEKLGKILHLYVDGRQDVMCEDMSSHILRPGLNAIPDGAVGDRVRLVYEVRERIGAWWGSLLKSDEPDGRSSSPCTLTSKPF